MSGQSDMENHSSPSLRGVVGVMSSSSWVSRITDCKRSLAGIDLAAGAVDFSRAESALFLDEKDAARPSR